MSMRVLIRLILIGGLAAACFAKAFGIVFLGEPRSEAARGALSRARADAANLTRRHGERNRYADARLEGAT